MEFLPIFNKINFGWLGEEEVTPPTSPSYAYLWTVGRSSTQIGFFNTLGGIVPGDWGSTPGDSISRLSITLSTDSMFMQEEDQSMWDGSDTIWLDIEGYGVQELNWTTMWYANNATSLRGYLDNLVPNIGEEVVLGVTVYTSAP